MSKGRTSEKWYAEDLDKLLGLMVQFDREHYKQMDPWEHLVAVVRERRRAEEEVNARYGK